MAELARAAIGAEVKGLQMRLNLRLHPSPRLRLDGLFGDRTADAVARFQRQHGLAPDGKLTAGTSALLAGPSSAPAPPNLAKFIPKLGVLDDFVTYVTEIESRHSSPSAVMAVLCDFDETRAGKRYLLVTGDAVGVLDFRHFFAAAAESYDSGLSRSKFGNALGGSPGQAMLLGVANEIIQCTGEAMARKLDSCFSVEDLGTNRLGAAFGEFVKVRETSADRRRLSELLREYLTRLQPVDASKLSTITTATGWDTALEALLGILAGMGDFLVPRAY